MSIPYESALFSAEAPYAIANNGDDDEEEEASFPIRWRMLGKKERWDTPTCPFVE
jgi:hypothetical protein